jgi:hypothetical protein
MIMMMRRLWRLLSVVVIMAIAVTIMSLVLNGRGRNGISHFGHLLGAIRIVNYATIR